MLNFLIKHFIPDCQNTSDLKVRSDYGMLGGVLGIICNLFLFVVKAVTGAAIGSIAVLSDGFNNLSDMGASFVSVIGARIGGKSADIEHPYGHGRAEYISALIISFLIMFFGLELLKSSVLKFFDKSAVNLTKVSACMLVLSVGIKLWMWSYNKKLAAAIDSDILSAAAKDSLNDVVSSLAVIFSAVVSQFTDFNIDAVAGVCVSVMIVITGFNIAKERINQLLGTGPSQEDAEKIEDILTENPAILGMHGLMIHDYGPGRKVASVHAEVKNDLSVCDIHYIIDGMEHKILEETGVDIVIHMDPVACVLPKIKLDSYKDTLKDNKDD